MSSGRHGAWTTTEKRKGDMPPLLFKGKYHAARSSVATLMQRPRVSARTRDCAVGSDVRPASCPLHPPCDCIPRWLQPSAVRLFQQTFLREGPSAKARRRGGRTLCPWGFPHQRGGEPDLGNTDPTSVQTVGSREREASISRLLNLSLDLVGSQGRAEAGGKSLRETSQTSRAGNRSGNPTVRPPNSTIRRDGAGLGTAVPRIPTTPASATAFARFQLPLGTVCGESNQPWVLELINCFNHKECGIMRSQAHQKHLPLPNTQASELTEQASSNIGTPAQTDLPSTLQSTQQPTFPATALALDRGLSYSSETVTPTTDHNLGAGPEAGENQKQLESSVDPPAGTSAIVPVLSLLAIVFILTAVLLYVLQKKRKQSRPHFSGKLHL
ncbi:PREDICTED: uncharacterized protein LOC102817510 [Chrysochloris asiatica]|uniref:C-X-C motif chemokine 16 n=1 Tax=Chrysochloris asiatica TaxID=185453 RepID=A0A9B0WPW7_CHRAS|nr:PREDICTED: uncharacterized protein LOC102817510 [Chrysochloris asiatica]